MELTFPKPKEVHEAPKAAPKEGLAAGCWVASEDLVKAVVATVVGNGAATVGVQMVEGHKDWVDLEVAS